MHLQLYASPAPAKLERASGEASADRWSGEAARALPEARGDHSEEKAADMRNVGHAPGLHLRHQADVEELDEKPEADKDRGGNERDAHKDEDDENGADAIARIRDQKRAHDGGDGSAGAEVGDPGGWVGQNLSHHGNHSARQVEKQESPAAHRVFDGRAERPEEDHVAQDVEPAGVQEHGRENGDGAVAGNHIGGNDGPVADEVVAVNQLLKKDKNIDENDEEGDGGHPRGAPGYVT